jgi:hypothetical protein
MYLKKSRHALSPNCHYPPESSPLGRVHNDANIFAIIGRCPGSLFVSNVYSTFCNSACISTVVSNLHPPQLDFNLGEEEEVTEG